jgi:peptide/nickel transport system substrate-binding protein
MTRGPAAGHDVLYASDNAILLVRDTACREMPMPRRIVLFVVPLLCAVGLSQRLWAQSQAGGELVYALHVTIAPSWFDPAEMPAQITPFGILYALHDAVVRPLPGERMGPALAESWRESPDGTVYEFTLRPGLKFHNGDPCTAEDVVFSFTRYKGVGAGEFKAKVKHVEAVDARTVRFQLHAPWPDFMTFYGTTASAA